VVDEFAEIPTLLTKKALRGMKPNEHSSHNDGSFHWSENLNSDVVCL
jgi:hypothetical protein